jgi:hypothetical protein
MGHTNGNMDAFEREVLEATHQRSQEWRDARLGKFTASEIHRLITPVMVERDLTDDELKERPKKGPGSRKTTVKEEDFLELSKGALTYVKEKVAEELTGIMQDSGTFEATEWGNEKEIMAVAEFEIRKGYKVQKAGFIPFTDHAGGSPDGLINDDTVLEIKCPFNSANQVEYLLTATEEEIRENHPDYWWQMQANMLFTKRQKCYFVTYDPRMPEHLKINMVVVHANADDQQRILDKLDLAIQKKKFYLKVLEPKP